jgi:hypothetical protein
MKPMTSPTVETVDLLDLKLLPAWVKEPAEPKRYADREGEDHRERPARHHHDRPPHGRKRSRIDRSQEGVQRAKTRANKQQVGRDSGTGREQRRPGRRRNDREENRTRIDKHPAPTRKPLQIAIRFVPYSPAFENVVAQIKSGSVAYSLFALARLFLEKPVGYEVWLTPKEESPLFQLGDDGTVSVDREFLERNAFRFAQRDFYQIEVVETDPIKGNFSNVARCRLSGTLLGPTNHHNYQPQLRSLYEQRFSRRMSFTDYQRQIEIVSDATLIERWKEEAQKVTTYRTLREETAVTFSAAVEAERHFRSHYLPALIRTVGEVTIAGASSRRLADRVLNRAVEDAWTQETRSPSNMMQELAGRFRQNGLHVFRHRRGMLFVSPIRVRPFVHEQTGVSPSVNAILEALKAGINGKQLFEKLTGDGSTGDAEPRRLALASDLRWLINEGYVIEFNDGSLDLPRVKATPHEPVTAVTAQIAKPVEPESVEAGEEALATTSPSAAYSVAILSDGAESPS